MRFFVPAANEPRQAGELDYQIRQPLTLQLVPENRSPICRERGELMLVIPGGNRADWIGTRHLGRREGGPDRAALEPVQGTEEFTTTA